MKVEKPNKVNRFIYRKLNQCDGTAVTAAEGTVCKHSLPLQLWFDPLSLSHTSLFNGGLLV